MTCGSKIQQGLGMNQGRLYDDDGEVEWQNRGLSKNTKYNASGNLTKTDIVVCSHLPPYQRMDGVGCGTC
jgi:hypothetical protein